MSAVEPRIMTLAEFQKASTPTNPFKRHRGTELHLIDQSVEAYDRVRNTPSVSTRRPVVAQIVNACNHWLTVKGAKTSDTSTLRRTAVTTLGTQAFEWLKYQAFAERKTATRVQTTVLGRGPTVRAMRPGYDQERALYVAQGKQSNPVSGSYMHGVMEARHNDFAGRSFSQLTVADYRALDDAYKGEWLAPDVMGDPGAMAKTKVPRQVLFLNKQERIKCLLLVRGGLLWEGFEAPFHTGITRRAYVIDEYGNVYSSNQLFDRTYSFNHSTFNAGKDVICAGTLQATEGKPTVITNASGHYKPTREHLHNAVRLLQQAGADLSALRVTVGEPDPNPAPRRAGKMIEHDYDDARTFLANMNAAPSRSVPEP